MEKRICSGCGQEKNIDEFGFKYKASGIRQTRCKVCTAAKSKEHYKNNTQKYLDKAKVQNDHILEENRKKLFAYFASHPCVD